MNMVKFDNANLECYVDAIIIIKNHSMENKHSDWANENKDERQCSIVSFVAHAYGGL